MCPSRTVQALPLTQSAVLIPGGLPGRSCCLRGSWQALAPSGLTMKTKGICLLERQNYTREGRTERRDTESVQLLHCPEAAAARAGPARSQERQWVSLWTLLWPPHCAFPGADEQDAGDTRVRRQAVNLGTQKGGQGCRPPTPCLCRFALSWAVRCSWMGLGGQRGGLLTFQLKAWTGFRAESSRRRS